MSGLFDEWAYTLYDSPLSPVAVVPEVHEAPRVEVPSPRLRPRAATCAGADGARASALETTLELKEDTPLIGSKWKDASVRKAWLAHADPAQYGFDEEAWRAEVAAVDAVRLDTRCAAQVAAQAHSDALNLARETDWLLHEVRDLVEHDLAPLRRDAARELALHERQAAAQAARTALQTGWTALERVQRELYGAAPRAVPQLERIFADVAAGQAFCAAHSDFPAAAAAADQWRLCGERALAVAGAYSAHELRKIAQRVTRLAGSTNSSNSTKNPSNSVSSASASGALIYGKFKSDAARLLPTLSLLQSHNKSPVWTDLQRTYCDLRLPLVSSGAVTFAAPLESYTEISDAFIDDARGALVQTRQLCQAETELFVYLFGKPSEQFYSWLGDLVDPLYTVVRRLIVRETDMARLCQVIVLSETGEEAEEIEGNVAAEMIASAAQSRLVFRASISIDALGRYEALPKDFLRARFPTVDTTLNLLGQLYQLLNPKVFNELAHRCVRECLLSLDTAVGTKMAVSTSQDTKIHLFHIKQLLILQSQIADFDLRNSVVHEVDFSGIRRLLNVAATTAWRGSISDVDDVPHSFRELVLLAWDSVPRVVEIMVDAMAEVFAALRRAVDRLCAAFVANVFALGPSPTDPAPLLADIRTNVASKFAELRSAIAEYTQEVEFTNFLLDSAQEAVLDRYTEEYRALDPTDQKSEQVMDIDTMAAWLSSAV